MHLLGVRSWSELNASFLHQAAPVVPGTQFSSFPLLGSDFPR
jgi:hypothetical protein